MPLCIPASAAELADGVYEVSVTLMHKEEEKESFGNKYVAPVALLEAKDGKKTITILLTTDMNGIEFSYYTNGSLSGDTKDGVPVKNVTVAGEIYKQGFEIPVMSDGDIGLKFSVPVMPMSPSARLRIDYSSAKLITAHEKETEPQTTEVSTTDVTEEKTTETVDDVSTSETETTEVTEDLVTEIATETEEKTTASKTTETEEKTSNEDKGVSPIIYAAVLVAIVVIALLLAKRIKGNKR